MPSKQDTIIEQLRSMSKEELLALILSNDLWFWRRTISLRDINRAKGEVVRRKAEAAFSRWEELDREKAAPSQGTKSLDAHFAFLHRLKESEDCFKRYLKLSAKADKLEFGHLDFAVSKGGSHDPE